MPHNQLTKKERLVRQVKGLEIDRVPSLGSRAAYAKQHIRDRLLDHKSYIHTYGEDMPEIRNWTWRGN